MKQKKLTIYHADGTEEVVYSKVSKEHFDCGGITAIGYAIYLENDVQIIVHPTLHRKIKVEIIDA